MTLLKKIHHSPTLDFFSPEKNATLKLPYVGGIAAGFPSPAEDFLDSNIDLNEALIKNPHSTFFARAKGNSMNDAGIENGNLLIIDKSLAPKTGMIAVCFLDGDFTVKRIRIENDCIWLVPANTEFNPILVTKDNDFLIWGIVLHVIKSL